MVKCLNEIDEHGFLPLQLAFDTNQLNIAKCLMSHGADLNKLDLNGLSFLWKAIQKGALFKKFIIIKI